MKATSAAQLDATTNGTVAPLEQLRPRVWALPLAMPTPNLPSVLSYLIVDDVGGVHVIDPGFDSDENWQRVLDALHHIGASTEQVVSATITHLHHDHLGMAERYRAHTPARLQLSAVEQDAVRLAQHTAGASALAEAATWGVPADRMPELELDFGTENDAPALEADVLLGDGDDLGVAGTSIRVVATPGHTTGSICLAALDDRLLFTGDHVLPTIFSGLGLGGPPARNPVSDYLDSLQRIAPYDEYEVAPGHGYRFTGLAERRHDMAEHHLRRSREAAAVLADEPGASVWEVASRLPWTAGWANLHGPYLRSALAQTSWHMQRAEALGA